MHQFLLIHTSATFLPLQKALRFCLMTSGLLLAGTEFDSADIRPELFFYNGKDREAGYPQREAEFEIADIRLEP